MVPRGPVTDNYKDFIKWDNSLIRHSVKTEKKIALNFKLKKSYRCAKYG